MITSQPIGSGRSLFPENERHTFLEYAIAREIARLNLEAVDQSLAAMAEPLSQKVA